jgi:hypothetical protein
LLPKRSAHQVPAELGPEDAERTIVLIAHHDAAHSAFFFNPAITETVGEWAPWVFEKSDTRPLRLRNATDGIFPLAAGYPCASLVSCNQWKNPSNYHWKTDTPENVDYATLSDAIRLTEAVIRRLDRNWV